MQKIILRLMVIVVIGLTVLNLAYDDRPEPDVVCTMANRHIDWTYFGK